jgi:hypothetical protein
MYFAIKSYLFLTAPPPPPSKLEAEFMNGQFCWGSGHNLESSQTWGFRIQCGGWGSVCRGGCELRMARRKTLKTFVPFKVQEFGLISPPSSPPLLFQQETKAIFVLEEDGVHLYSNDGQKLIWVLFVDEGEVFGSCGRVKRVHLNSADRKV